MINPSRFLPVTQVTFFIRPRQSGQIQAFAPLGFQKTFLNGRMQFFSHCAVITGNGGP